MRKRYVSDDRRRSDHWIDAWVDWLGWLNPHGAVLVYGLGHHEKAAIAESLAIVGAIAVIASIPYQFSGSIYWRRVAFFGLPGIVSTFAGAWIAQFLPGSIQLMTLAVVMASSAFFMLRKSPQPEGKLISVPTWLIILLGVFVGILTGLVGVGGGFLIVPALTLFGGLTMRQAIGTSLVIIALNSSIGFAKYWQVLRSADIAIDWQSIICFVTIGAVGSMIGNWFNSYLPQRTLRNILATVLACITIFIIWNEAPKLWSLGQVPTTADWPIARAETMSTAQKQNMERALKARDALFGRLLGRLESLLKELKPSAVIGVCQHEAPEFAKQISAEHEVKIGRTSLKLRNTKNQPPAWAQPIIVSKPSEPVWLAHQSGAVRGLLPIRIKPACLACHGPVDRLSPDLLAVLKATYPDDRATGYAEGDLRGWFWIEVETSKRRDQSTEN